jgi:exonuclease SbcD
MQEMSPLEIARLYYQEAEGEEMDEELCELMSSVVQKVREKNNLR